MEGEAFKAYGKSTNKAKVRTLTMSPQNNSGGRNIQGLISTPTTEGTPQSANGGKHVVSLYPLHKEKVI